MTSPTRPSRWRRRLLMGAPALAAGGLGAWAWRDGILSASAQVARPPPADRSGPSHAFTLTLDAGVAGTAVNRSVLGSNVQWVDGGDEMLGADGRLDPAMLTLAKSLAPTVLRYPGGAQSDGYHWALGMGDMATRGLNNHVNANTMQPTRMGTREFLELCEATGAAPLITVNVVTGTADEAAQWLKATNVTRLRSSVSGQWLPRVAYWEIGNEPYLKQDKRPDLDIAPEEFARRANVFIRALRAVDPSIRIGLPLTQDVRNGVPVTPYPGFTQRVLAIVNEPFDFASVHNAYMPFGLDAVDDPDRLYWGAMAAARSVQADFAAVRDLLARLRPGAALLPLAVTEYSPIFTLGAGRTDDWIATPAGALYVADVLRVFAATPGLLLANQWSLSGNWKFGAIHAGKFPRPVFEAMRLFGQALRGELLPQPAQRVQSTATRAVGLVAAVPALPLVDTMLTRETAADGSRKLRLLLIHKDPLRRAIGRVTLAAGPPPAAAQLTLLACTDRFDPRDAAGVVTRSEQVLQPAADGAFNLNLPPCSIAMLSLG